MYKIDRNYYLYKIYGLIIESEIELPEAIEIIKKDENTETINIDVIVRYDKMTTEIKDKINNGIYAGNNENEFWFMIDGVAIFRICDGKKIFIECKGGSKQDIKTFLLGSAFGTLLIQRNIVAIHGGTIVVNDKGLIITGDMGTGKSTLTLAFGVQGYKFLADDVSAISMNLNGKFIVNPAYPQQKLCRDAAIKLGLNIKDFVRIDEGRDKFAIPSQDNFMNNSKELCYIAEVTVRENESMDDYKVTIEEIVGVEKLNLLIKNIYRVEIATIIGIKSEYFNNIVSIAKQIKYYKIIRPKNSFTVNEQIKLIRSQIGA